VRLAPRRRAGRVRRPSVAEGLWMGLQKV
jgi:hypothetical protein